MLRATERDRAWADVAKRRISDVYTITILDRDDSGVLRVGLEDVLRAVRPAADNAEWTITCVEALGAAAERLYAAQEQQRRISTADLEELATALDQVVDGVFSSHRKGDLEPFLILRAVDGTSWDVTSDDRGILERVRVTFAKCFEAGEIG
jgi:hypothetical protein